jgi:hypothetical protein
MSYFPTYRRYQRKKAVLLSTAFLSEGRERYTRALSILAMSSAK